jgi:outer membrane protein TolC
MATASMEIFDGGRAHSDLAEAKSLKDEAGASFQDTSRGVEQDVRQAYLNLQAAGQTIETARARLAQAQEAYDVATVRYQAGVGTATEVADSLAALTASRTNLDRATFNHSTAYARLQRALGNIEY